MIRLGGTSNATGWANTDMHDAVSLMNFYGWRYPSGTVANFWDWMDGWFYSNATISCGFRVPYKVLNYPKRNCSLEAYADALKRIGATPIVDLNVMTSDPLYQSAFYTACVIIM